MGIHAPEGVDADAEEARQDELGGRPKVDLADRFATLIVTDHDRAIRVGGQRLIVPDGSHPDSVAEHFRDTLLSRARERRPNATQDTWAGLVTALEDVARSRDRADPDTLRLLRQAIDGA
jgi:hypothetical protein